MDPYTDIGVSAQQQRDEGQDQTGSQQQANARGFVGKERERFIRTVAVGQFRSYRGCSPKNWAYEGGSDRDRRGARVLRLPETESDKTAFARTQKKLGVPLLRVVEPGSKLPKFQSITDRRHERWILRDAAVPTGADR